MQAFAQEISNSSLEKKRPICGAFGMADGTRETQLALPKRTGVHLPRQADSGMPVRGLPYELNKQTRTFLP